MFRGYFSFQGGSEFGVFLRHRFLETHTQQGRPKQMAGF